MTLPASVRINAQFPFPSLVQANGPVTITKTNGIWTIGFQIANLGSVASNANLSTLEVLVWNTVLNTFQQTTIQSIVSALPPATTITNANSPYTPLSTDTFLLVDTTGGAVTINLTLAASRNGVPLSIKDYKGNSVTNNITIVPNGAETLDGYTNGSPLILKSNYDGVRLLPITAAYTIAP